MTLPDRSDSEQRPRWRWRLALSGVLMAFGAIAGLSLAGFEFRRGDRDLMLALGLAVEIAFGIWGFLLGRSYESRLAERRTARQSRERLDELAALQARVGRLETLASVGQVAGSIAHEIRNPLAIIRSMVQNLAEKDPDSAGVAKACRDVLEEVDRLARATDSLVGLVRPVQPRFVMMDLGELFERASWLAEKIAQPGRELHRSGPKRRAYVRADPDLLCQVVLGLVTNATRVSPPGSTIDLGCGTDNGRAVVSVTDSGPGVPADLRDRIFEPFYTTRDGGAGLGLAVARQIIDAHGGRISVEDAPGRGARFVVQLELVDPPERA